VDVKISPRPLGEGCEGSNVEIISIMYHLSKYLRREAFLTRSTNARPNASQTTCQLSATKEEKKGKKKKSWSDEHVRVVWWRTSYISVPEGESASLVRHTP
jgi:hypothetical protein